MSCVNCCSDLQAIGGVNSEASDWLRWLTAHPHQLDDQLHLVALRLLQRGTPNPATNTHSFLLSPYVQFLKRSYAFKNCNYVMFSKECTVHTASMVYYPEAHHRSCFQWRVEWEDRSPEG